MENQQKYQLIYSTNNWNIIKQELIKLTKNQFTKVQLIQSLNNLVFMVTGQKQQMKFAELVKVEENKLRSIFGKAAGLVLTHQTMKHNINLFLINENKQILFKKSQIILLICLMILNLTIRPKFQDENRNYNFGDTNFSYIFCYQQVQTIGILQYLQIALNLNQKELAQKLKIKRYSEKLKNDEFFLQKNIKMAEVQMTQSSKSIQDYYQSIKIDFANQYIGGGALCGGAVQQQIMFINHPQLYASMLLCQKMEQWQCLAFIGFRKYFQTEGYGQTLKFKGKNPYKYKVNKQNIVQQYIVGIDALCFPEDQFDKISILRQLNKSYIGFNSIKILKVASGNWGCGVFGGDPQLKFLIQWISTSLLKKKLIYCPFNRKNTDFYYGQQIIKRLKKLNTSDVFKIIIEFESNKETFADVFDYILKSKN